MCSLGPELALLDPESLFQIRVMLGVEHSVADTFDSVGAFQLRHAVAKLHVAALRLEPAHGINVTKNFTMSVAAG